jgi:uncharacterized protein YndB with AHSA1/START domain
MTGIARDEFVVTIAVHVPAPPVAVWGYLTDPALYVRWMGSQAALDPVAGGSYHVRMADGFAAAGEFVTVDPPRVVAFTWGFADEEAAGHARHEQTEATSGGVMPAGSTRVTVSLAADAGGTRVTLRHDDLPNAELRAAHQVAWETYLPRLAIAAAGGDPGPDPHAGENLGFAVHLSSCRTGDRSSFRYSWDGCCWRGRCAFRDSGWVALHVAPCK